jgi:hypothetical protein
MGAERVTRGDDMTPEEYKHGPGSFWVQLTCGAVLGAILGIGLSHEFARSFIVSAGISLGWAGIFGLIAGFWGDKFWELLIRFFSGYS